MTVATNGCPSLPGIVVESFESIIKSEKDKCQYRLITLYNGLQALLVHEADLDMASAALDVNVGSLSVFSIVPSFLGFFSDPDDIPGLAHFLEHLLFMGTHKYPRENEYSSFLSEHGGHSNAFTADEHTNYFFEVAHGYLEQALDRFAQFFIAPLFDPSGTDREMNAVNSENKKNLQNDAWRINQLEHSLSNPHHPYSKFGVGNIETLGNIPRQRGQDVRQTLLDFHNRYYSANLMKLVVYGREPLDVLERWVSEKFMLVPNKQTPIPTWLGSPWRPEDTKATVNVKTLRDSRALSITWLLPEMKKHYLTKPEAYYSHLLGHEGKGSILSYLKRRGWATGVSAGAESDSTGFSFFQIAIELSPQGLQNQVGIVRIVFQYLKMLRERGPQLWIFQESKKISDISFRFREKSPSSSYSSQLAGHMHLYPPERILCAPHIVEHYNEALLRNILEYFAPCNFRVMVTTSEIDSSRLEIREERWYGTQYTLEPMSEEFIKELETIALNDELDLPHPNIFIPDDLGTPNEGHPIKRRPALIIDTPELKLWHKKDDTFLLPKASVSILFRSPVAYASAEMSVRTRLFLALVEDSLEEYLYDAHLAGLGVELGETVDGMHISVAGFHDKLPILLRKLVERMRTLVVLPERYELFRDQLLRVFKDARHKDPYWHSSYYFGCLLHERIWLYNELQQAVETTSVHDLKNVYALSAERVQLEMLFHGNYTQDAAKEIAQSLYNLAKPAKIHPALIKPLRVVSMPPGTSAIFRPEDVPNDNSSTGNINSVETRVLTLLFVQTFSEPFFNILRTQEQLGYVVQHYERVKGLATGLCFLIQSEHDPVFLDARIEKFLSTIPEQLSVLTDAEFKNNITAAVHLLLAKKERMSEETSEYWGHITRQQYDFERAQVDAEAIQALTKADLLAFCHENIMAGAPQRRKLAVHIWSASKKSIREQSSPDKFEDARVYTDVATFVASMPLFPTKYNYPCIEKLSC